MGPAGSGVSPGPRSSTPSYTKLPHVFTFHVLSYLGNSNFIFHTKCERLPLLCGALGPKMLGVPWTPCAGCSSSHGLSRDLLSPLDSGHPEGRGHLSHFYIQDQAELLACSR